MKRIVRLQTQMRRREEWRLANIEREDVTLADRQAQLTHFMDAETGGVSALMAGSTARRLRSVAEARANLVGERRLQNARLLVQQQRLSTAERLHDDLESVVERFREDEDLTAVLEADMATRKTSLP